MKILVLNRLTLKNWFFFRDVMTKIWYTLPSKKMNLLYSILMYWTNFWQPTIHVQQNICEKTLIKVGSSHLHASFGSFWVQIGQIVEALWYFKLSEEFEICVIFLRKHQFYHFQTFFKVLLCLQKITYLDVKGAKRTVKMWGTNFYSSLKTVKIAVFEGKWHRKFKASLCLE